MRYTKPSCILIFLLLSWVSSAQQRSPLLPAYSDIWELTTNICTYLVIANSSGLQHESAIEIENYFLDYNGWTRETKNYQAKVVQFWNENSENFICTNHRQRYKDQHFVMRVIEMRMYSPILIDWMMKDGKLYPFDFNAIQNLEGKRITSLDFIDSIINDPSIHPDYEMSEIRELREILVTFYDAKHAAKLSD